jgi:hypothetical protein
MSFHSHAIPMFSVLILFEPQSVAQHPSVRDLFEQIRVEATTKDANLSGARIVLTANPSTAIRISKRPLDRPASPAARGCSTPKQQLLSTA